MFGGGSEGDRNYALFRARLLAGPPRYDPAEEHMHRVLRTIGLWSLALALVDTVVVWMSDGLVAAMTTAALTIVVLAILSRLRKPDVPKPA